MTEIEKDQIANLVSSTLMRWDKLESLFAWSCDRLLVPCNLVESLLSAGLINLYWIWR